MMNVAEVVVVGLVRSSWESRCILEVEPTRYAEL